MFRRGGDCGTHSFRLADDTELTGVQGSRDVVFR